MVPIASLRVAVFHTVALTHPAFFEQIRKQGPIGVAYEKRRELCRKPLPQIALVAGITIAILRQALQHKRTEHDLAPRRLRTLLPVQSRLQTALALFELFDALRHRLSHNSILL